MLESILVAGALVGTGIVLAATAAWLVRRWREERAAAQEEERHLCFTDDTVCLECYDWDPGVDLVYMPTKETGIYWNRSATFEYRRNGVAVEAFTYYGVEGLTHAGQVAKEWWEDYGSHYVEV